MRPPAWSESRRTPPPPGCRRTRYSTLSRTWIPPISDAPVAAPGHGSKVDQNTRIQLPELHTRVRFPSPAQENVRGAALLCREIFRGSRHRTFVLIVRILPTPHC